MCIRDRGLTFCSCTKKGDIGPSGASGNSGEEVYTISFQNGLYPESSYSGIEDNRIRSDSPDTNYGNTTGGLLIGQNSSSTYRVLIKFREMEKYVPENIKIKKAYLVLYSYITSSTTTISAYALSSGWDEMTSSWVSRTVTDLWATPGGDFNSSSSVSNSVLLKKDSYEMLEINPDIIADWLSNTYNNYGLILKANNETVTNYNGIYLSEAADILKRPKLILYYTK